ncbi:MAG: beta-lactamase family protein [Bryobacteraceae bacterium]|nr:beta-lactamase family protein [Bryobacteraceae bacterium]
MHRRIFLVWLACGAAWAQTGVERSHTVVERVALAPDKRERIERLIQEEMGKAKAPGVSVAVGMKGEVVYASGFGLADIENNIAVTPQTRIRLGSISKPITAVAVLQLAERGKLDLDAEVQEYLPQFPRKQWPLRIRHLLSHSGGIRHYQGREMDSVDHYYNRVDPLRIFSGDPLLYEPGSKFLYTTYGYNLLGAVVESITGDFVGHLRDHVFTPAGMESTGPDDHFAIIQHRSRGYTLHGTMLANAGLADTSNKIPGGGLIGTASDLARFAMATGAGKLLKPESLRAMWTRFRTTDGVRQGYGMGWTVADEPRLQVGHTGGQQGATTHLIYYPEDDVAVAVMLNRDSAPVTGFSQGIARIVLDSGHAQAPPRGSRTVTPR